MAAVEAAPTSGAGALPDAIKANNAMMADNKPSFEPGKKVEEFRVYHTGEADGGSSWDSVVSNHYRLMRTNQTVAFVDKMVAKWGKFDKAKMTIREAFEALKGYVDSSDPDTALPNLVHMLQTAERARAAGEPDYVQVVALIHDIGKVMFLWGAEEDGQVGKAEGPQFALGGDTWVVGCKLPESSVFPQFNALNPDMSDAVYSTELGIYEPACGIMNCKFAFGHDEYAYMLMKHNKCPIPEEGLAMLRLHSCYPWHRGGAYRHLMKPGDEDLLAAVLRFNTYDLYSKSDGVLDVEAVWPYYQSLIDKYMPGKLEW